MFQSSKVNFLFLLFCLLLLSSITFAQTFECDPENRPNRDDCTDQSYEETCAYYSDSDCPLEICVRDASNGCDACSDPNTIYYKKEPCPYHEDIYTCNLDIICDNNANNNIAYSPVCGLRKSATNELESKTFANECEFCQDGSYLYYQFGPCRKDINYCHYSVSEDDEDGENGEERGNVAGPVCASLIIGDLDSVYTTVSSSSEACSDPAVGYWIAGECGAPPFDNRTYCLTDARPQACTADENPVCAFTSHDVNGPHKVASNGCSACAEPYTIFHTPGECVFYCNVYPEVDVYDCLGNFQPVCGTYEEDGEERTASFRNECMGCYDGSKKPISYVEGFCPGDKGIRCENDALVHIEGVPEPVCGYSTENCDDDSCRKTFQEPADACGDETWNTIWYSTGPCPGDE